MKLSPFREVDLVVELDVGIREVVVVVQHGVAYRRRREPPAPLDRFETMDMRRFVHEKGVVGPIRRMPNVSDCSKKNWYSAVIHGTPYRLVSRYDEDVAKIR